MQNIPPCIQYGGALPHGSDGDDDVQNATRHHHHQALSESILPRTTHFLLWQRHQWRKLLLLQPLTTGDAFRGTSESIPLSLGSRKTALAVACQLGVAGLCFISMALWLDGMHHRTEPISNKVPRWCCTQEGPWLDACQLNRVCLCCSSQRFPLEWRALASQSISYRQGPFRTLERSY